MTVTEWSQAESLEPIGAPSSDDLFDGDILGDELMDIYNAAVVGSGDGNDIPSLLDSPDLNDAKKDSNIDDGFGAFRPSTSFSNIPSLLQESVNEGVAPNVQSSSAGDASENATRVVSSTSLSISPTPGVVAPTPVVTTPAGTKRKSTAATDAGSPKRRSTGSKQPKNAVKGTANNKASNEKTALAPITLPSNSSSAASTTAVPNVKLEVATITPLSANTVVMQQQPNVSIPVAPSVQAVTTAVPVAKAPQATAPSAPVAAPPASVLSNPPTEADFKSVAQAAVNNLIMNAGSATKSAAGNKSTKGRSDSSPASSSSSTKPETTNATRVDTSTEHVKALTGSNWVAVCGGITTGETTANQSNNEKLCNRARRSNLTPDERARQNRDRNREHARNTRLRKKAYVEELKATLSALVSQRDTAELEKRHTSQRELEQREVRFRVLEEFLKLRGRNEANVARWAAILEEKFTLTLPVASFRQMVHSNNSAHRNANALHDQVLTGVVEVMNDSSLCSTFLQTLRKAGNNDTIILSYDCERNNFFMDNCVAMLDFSATTHGASEQGIEIIIKGNIRAKFCPASNKLISVVLSFDTGAIVSQINLINKVKESSEAEAAAVAAQHAANEADALLDSLQMPHFEPPDVSTSINPDNNINVVPPSSGSSAASSRNEEKAVISSDDENQNYRKEDAEDMMSTL